MPRYASLSKCNCGSCSLATTWDSKFGHFHSYRFRNTGSDSTIGSCVSGLWVFTCYLNIWKFLSKVLKKNGDKVGWCWGNQTRVQLWKGIGNMESETKKADETGPQWWKIGSQEIEKNIKTCQISFDFWLFLSFTVLMLGLDLERHSKIL